VKLKFIPGKGEPFFAWGRYLYWAELMRRDWYAYEEKDDNEGHAEWLGVFCQWGASLYVVIEGWETIKFQDPIIDALLKIADYKDALRRLRNGTFYYQPELISPKLIGLFRSEETVLWLYTLHEEFNRWLRDVVEHVEQKALLSAEQSREWREDFSKVVGWLPLRMGEEQLEQTRKKFDAIRAELDSSGSTTEAAQDLRSSLGLLDKLVTDRAQSEREFRRECLARVGLNPNNFIP
jgi:hypothetical protein